MATRERIRRPKLAIPVVDKRRQFWLYCNRAANAAKCRARRQGVPFDIDAHHLDRMFVAQEWTCAVSWIAFNVPSVKDEVRDPFAPSIDRIVPNLGYVDGNIRLVCNIVNFAINEWGIDALHRLVAAMEWRRRNEAGELEHDDQLSPP